VLFLKLTLTIDSGNPKHMVILDNQLQPVRKIFRLLTNGSSCLTLAIVFLFAFRPTVLRDALAKSPNQLTILRSVKGKFQEKLNLRYGPHLANCGNLLDLCLPSLGNPPYPLIVCIHGGGWTAGDKSDCFTGELLASGYATASVNYRLTSFSKFPAQIEDCKTAVSWLRSHAASLNIDPERIGVWGASAGGHLAALLGTTGDIIHPAWAAPKPGCLSNKVEAVCDWCGPSDLLTIADQVRRQNEIVRPVCRLLGTAPWLDPDLARQASPVTYAHKGCPPFLIMHGSADPIVPSAQSKELSDCLIKQGVDCTFELIPGGSHNFYNTENARKMVSFFDRTLKKK